MKHSQQCWLVIFNSLVARQRRVASPRVEFRLTTRSLVPLYLAFVEVPSASSAFNGTRVALVYSGLRP